jgi:predicted amidohydrolase
MGENKIKLSVVDFRAAYGDKEANLAKMRRIIERAAETGSDMIVFPETALIGYDNIPEISKPQKMQTLLAEYIPGPSSEAISKLAVQLGVYVIFGLSERDAADAARVYNAVAVCKPDGEILSYRKIHLPGDEKDWASRGTEALVFNTKWGLVGLSICYDTYSFPELTRYARAKGARLCINCTACDTKVFKHVPLQMQLETNALTNYVFIATAGLSGDGPRNRFIGGSSIIGISPESTREITYYAGAPFSEALKDAEAGGDAVAKASEDGTVYTAEIDLGAFDTRFNTPIFAQHAGGEKPDFVPEIYSRLYAELANEMK